YDLEQILDHAEHDGKVRVSVKTHRCGRGFEGMARVELVKDVGIFVKRRTVTDFNLAVDDRRPHRQRDEPLAIAFGQRFEHPMRGCPRCCVETFRLIHPERHFVVVAADDCLWFEIANQFDDSVRIRTIADDVAEDERLFVASLARVDQTRGQSFEVRVDVGQDQIAHQASSQWTSSSTIAGIRACPASTRYVACAYAARLPLYSR